MVDLKEAIAHAMKIANSSDVCSDCAKEHEQLVDFLEELQQYRNTGLKPEEILPTVQKWIPVAERLPEDGARVLTACDDGLTRLGISKGGFPSVVNREHRFSDVTHWMPLPEPPKD